MNDHCQSWLTTRFAAKHHVTLAWRQGERNCTLVHSRMTIRNYDGVHFSLWICGVTGWVHCIEEEIINKKGLIAVVADIVQERATNTAGIISTAAERVPGGDSVPSPKHHHGLLYNEITRPVEAFKRELLFPNLYRNFVVSCWRKRLKLTRMTCKSIFFMWQVRRSNFGCRRKISRLTT